MTLTAAQCAKLEAKDKPYKVTDSRGLVLLIQSNGSKYWRYSYRFNGKQKTLALGVWPTVSAKAARIERDKAKALIAKGVDTSEDRRDQRAGRMDSSGQSFRYVVTKKQLESYNKAAAGSDLQAWVTSTLDAAAEQVTA